MKRNFAGKVVVITGAAGGLGRALARAFAAAGACIAVLDLDAAAAEALAAEQPAAYDAVCCMEMIEHVPDPAQTIAACATLVKPGGHVFFSTINRNPKAFLLAIVGAEYVLRLLPRGTHEYAKFVKPSELERWARAAGLRLERSIGLHLDPLGGHYRLGPGLDVNYMMDTVRTIDGPR